MSGAIGGAGKTRPARALTHRTVEAFKPEAAPYRVPDARCAGLAVRVATDGVLTWDLAFRIKGAGKVRRLSLGRFPEVPLDAARDRANELTKAGRAGQDLIADQAQTRAAAAERLTVEGLIVEYVKRRVTGRLRTAKELESRLRRALAPELGEPADDLRRRDMRALFDACADGGHEREAEKRRQTVGAMFRWALSQDLVEIDPTAGLAAYDPGTPGERVLSAAEVRALWGWLGGSGVPAAHADVMRLQLATGARCGEIAGMRADEVDRAAWTWTLPAERSKNAKQRVTPIVGTARVILEAALTRVPRGFLFVSERGGPLTSSHVGQTLIARRARLPIAAFTSHDLRRTVATMMAEGGVALDLIAAIVGHEAGTRETRTLIRHYVKTDMLDRKRPALDAWDARLRAMIAGEAAAPNVTDLSSAARRTAGRRA